jgi:L-lactate dehydrogenase complex protein LldG
MNSKQEILTALRRTRLPDVALPSVPDELTTYADPAAQFRQVVAAVGGQTFDVQGPAELAAALRQLDAYRAAANIWSLVPEVPSQGHHWESVGDPHALETLDFLVAAGQFAVAENGAVWITDDHVPHRAALFITQHLALVVPAREIVHNMHEAYQRISFDKARFGVFISGPSKTADIEQALVIGAHGARSATVLLVH